MLGLRGLRALNNLSRIEGLHTDSEVPSQASARSTSRMAAQRVA